MMKCIKCNKKADYIIDGNSLCADCKKKKETRENEYFGTMEELRMFASQSVYPPSIYKIDDTS